MDKRDLGAPDMRIHYVRVTNNLDRDFTDRYDGVPVVIEAGSSQNLDLDMAAHFFGYSYEVSREAMFRHVSKRQGWNILDYIKVNPATGKTLAQETFDKIDIKPVIYRMVEEKPDQDAPILADPQPPAIDDMPNPLPKRKTGS